MARTAESVKARAAAVRLLGLDVDGTLTDGKLYIGGGQLCRAFCVLDGLGVRRFVDAGGVAAIITAAKEEEGGIDIRLRAAQMGVTHIYTGVTDKGAMLRQLLAAEGLEAAQAAFAGDDLPDLSAMREAGFAAAPATAAAEVRAAAHYICAQPAGGGAVREICELIMAAQAGGAAAE